MFDRDHYICMSSALCALLSLRFVAATHWQFQAIISHLRMGKGLALAIFNTQKGRYRYCTSTYPRSTLGMQQANASHERALPTERPLWNGTTVPTTGAVCRKRPVSDGALGAPACSSASSAWRIGRCEGAPTMQSKEPGNPQNWFYVD